MTKSNTLDITTTNDRPAESADMLHDQQQDSRTDDSRTDSATAGHDTADAGTAKRRRTNTSPAVKYKYNAATYDNIQIRIARGSKSAIQTAAAEHGMSMAAYITAAINAYAGREIVPPLDTNPYI